MAEGRAGDILAVAAAEANSKTGEAIVTPKMVASNMVYHSDQNAAIHKVLDIDYLDFFL